MLAKELVDLAGLTRCLGQTTPVIGALARETPAIPIVFVTVSDPISSGFAADLAHPGGNITGFADARRRCRIRRQIVGAAEGDCTAYRARGAPVPPGRPATPILHAFNSSRGIVL